MSIIRACLLCYLGYESLSVTASQFQQNKAPSISLFRAVGVNFFNPNLYIYWLTICGPLSVSALHVSFATMLLFIGVFFLSITSAKLGIALALGSVRQSLNLKVIIWINRLLGIVMLVIAATFFWKGWSILCS
jgi:threonine/homoserine/homoserine lactone efflux protein